MGTSTNDFRRVSNQVPPAGITAIEAILKIVDLVKKKKRDKEVNGKLVNGEDTEMQRG